eukprot:scaffold358530_cov37-Attheya_sp.AAC.1
MSNGGCDQKLKSKRFRHKIRNTTPRSSIWVISLGGFRLICMKKTILVQKTMSNGGCDQQLQGVHHCP